MTDTLRVGTTYLDDNSGLALTRPAPGLLVWTVPPGDLDSFTTDVFELAVRIVENSPGSSLTNRVEIVYTGPDADLSNNVDLWTLQLPGSGWFTFLLVVFK